MAKAKKKPTPRDCVGKTIKYISAPLDYGDRTATIEFDDGSSLEFYAALWGGCNCADAELELTYNEASK